MTRVTFVAGEPDSAGAFNLLSDIVADQHLPSSYEREKIYAGITHPSGAAARATLIAGINQGRLLVNYVGHSAPNFWGPRATRTENDKYFDRSDGGKLTNADRLPIVLSLSSSDGQFHFPGLPAISEVMLRAAGKGVIAWWGGTGQGLSAGHNIMDVGFFDAVFRDGMREIGRATHQGYVKLYNQAPSLGFLIDTFVLFGDPATKLALPDH
jgi:hypothetical protein